LDWDAWFGRLYAARLCTPLDQGIAVEVAIIDRLARKFVAEEIVVR
jgi:hypothetical protein